MSDKDLIPQLLTEAWDVGRLDEAQARAAKKLFQYDGEKFPSNACAITLSVLLQDAGIDVPDIFAAFAMGKELRDKRGWTVVNVGDQHAGDIGSTCGSTPQHGVDHVYLVLQNMNGDEMTVADNQATKPHFRWASGAGGKSPTRFFLRAPDASFGPFLEHALIAPGAMAAPAGGVIFPPTAPFSGVADLYEGNDFNAKKLWNAGVRMVIHKIGQWRDDRFSANKAIYSQRKADWIALGGIWAAYYLPYAQGTADGHFAHMEACDSDPNIWRAIDWEPQSEGGPIASKATISALAGLIYQKYRRYPLKYGSRSTLNYGTDSQLDKCENWFANPNGGKIPTSFNPVKPPSGDTPLWQWTEDDYDIVKKWDGIDFSAFNGTADELAAKFKMEPPNEVV